MGTQRIRNPRPDRERPELYTGAKPVVQGGTIRHKRTGDILAEELDEATTERDKLQARVEALQELVKMYQESQAALVANQAVFAAGFKALTQKQLTPPAEENGHALTGAVQ
jgi:hypothetical protein